MKILNWRDKRGDIWVSAVLYIALGIVAISLILAAAIPAINNMKDRNTVVQTKELLYSLDKSIRDVSSEGPGSQRDLSPLVIKAGKMYVDENGDNKIKWSMETKAFILEPDVKIKEGSVSILLENTNIEGRYLVTLELDYKDVAKIFLDEESKLRNPLSGQYSLIIRNTGEYSNELPKVAIKLS